MADCCEKKKPNAGGGMPAVVKLVVKTFLEPRHYRQLQRILGTQWDNCHSLTAAVRLMEAHGVKIAPDEEQRLAQLPEERMIDSLVGRMPAQSREQFDHFFLQLSFIASTTTRLRAGLEGGAPEAIEEALDNAENVGVLPYLLKMAVAQAGQEVKAYTSAHEEWLQETDKKISPLIRSQAAQMASQKQLTQAKALLGMLQYETKEKTRTFLLALMNNNNEALLTNVIQSWGDYTKRLKQEAQIREEYKERIEQAKARLREFREKRVELSRTFLSRMAEGRDLELMALGFSVFRQEVELGRAERANQSKKHELDGRLEEYAKEASSRAKKVLARWCANSAEGLLSLSFTGWVSWLSEARECKGQQQVLEGIIEETRQFCREQRIKTLSLINSAVDEKLTDFLSSIMSVWAEVVQDKKHKQSLEAALVTSSDRLGHFVLKSKANAGVVLGGEFFVWTTCLLTVCVAQWKREAKVERMRRYGKEKNMKRKQELMGVRGLFKNFANELESSLKEGTPRVEVAAKGDRRLRAASSGPRA